MVLVVRLVLSDGGQGPVLVGAAKAAVIKTVDDHRGIRRESGAVGLHLREDDGDRGGAENPAPFCDGVRQHPEGCRRVGELVSVTSPYEERWYVVLLVGHPRRNDQVPGEVREGVH